MLDRTSAPLLHPARERHKELIEWSVAAFVSNADADPAEIEELLIVNGFSKGDVARAIDVLPIAFGRRLIEGAKVPAVPDGPLFDAAAARAKRANRKETEKIGLRSSEVIAANQLLHKGSKLEDLMFATAFPPHVCAGPLLRQWSLDVPINFGPFVDQLEALVVAATLSREPHWLRIFVAQGETLLGFEALLDNEPWPPAMDLVQQWPWPSGVEHAYALRNFFFFLPLE